MNDGEKGEKGRRLGRRRKHINEREHARKDDGMEQTKERYNCED